MSSSLSFQSLNEELVPVNNSLNSVAASDRFFEASSSQALEESSGSGSSNKDDHDAREPFFTNNNPQSQHNSRRNSVESINISAAEPRSLQNPRGSITSAGSGHGSRESGTNNSNPFRDFSSDLFEEEYSENTFEDDDLGYMVDDLGNDLNTLLMAPSDLVTEVPVGSATEQDERTSERGVEYNRYELTRSDILNTQPDFIDYLGIPWHLLRHSRSDYRLNRVKNYYNYTNISHTIDSIRDEITSVENNGNFYQFYYSKLKEVVHVPHFQLRNLLKARSRSSVYYGHSTDVKKWDPTNKVTSVAMDVKAGASASLFRITSLSVKYDLILAGGYYGEIACRKIDSEDQGSTHIGIVSDDDNGITNYIEAVRSRSGNIAALCSNNDSCIRFMSLSSDSLFKQLSMFQFDFALNCTRLSPDTHLLSVVGDSTSGYLIDAKTGSIIHELEGHLDFSFACAWSPDGFLVATGNQDKTTRIYDLRNTSKSLYCLEGKMASIRSIEFSEDGQFMAMAEAADFVHIFDVKNGFRRSQTIDIFGEIGGISFTPDSESLFLCSCDEMHGGIVEFERIKYDVDGFL